MIGPFFRRLLAYRPKFTIGRLMIAVAVLAPFLAILRSGAAGSFLGGIIIVAGCVVALAIKLTVDAIARHEAKGEKLGWWRKVWLALASSGVALAVIGLADFTFLIVYYSVHVMVNHPHVASRVIGLEGLITGVLISVFATIRLRRAIKKMREDRARSQPPVTSLINIDSDE